MGATAAVSDDRHRPRRKLFRRWRSGDSMSKFIVAVRRLPPHHASPRAGVAAAPRDPAASTGFGHIALAVDDAAAACAAIKKRGGKVVREAGPMQHGTTVIAFVEDPDGYRIELIQKKPDALAR